MNRPPRALALTTINAPNPILREIDAGAKRHAIPFYIAGDTKSPSGFSLPWAKFLGVEEQVRMFPEFAAKLPTRHYARKNVAYLAAAQSGVDWIQETDDDNIPQDDFWDPVGPELSVRLISSPFKWINAYEVFAELPIWPRGYPLEEIRKSANAWEIKELITVNGYIRQGLADDNPDVDAVYRLLMPLPFTFKRHEPVMLAAGKWCPFNSQNTLFHRRVFPLLYLPSYCSFRMTDIWRSFVAQRCLWELGEGIIFHQSTVRQERNEHDLKKDFEDEVTGYLENNNICSCLDAQKLVSHDIGRNLVVCYEGLARAGYLPDKELELVRIWARHFE